MLVLISIGLLAVIFLVIISPTADAESNSYDALDGDLYSTNSPGGPLGMLSHQTICPLMIDDDSAEYRDWTPWTYPPICIPPRDDKSTTSESSRHCVFIVSSLRRGPEMSLITAPDVASNLPCTLQDPDIALLEQERGVHLHRHFLFLNYPTKSKRSQARESG